MNFAGLIQVSIQYSKIYQVYHLMVLPGVNTTWLGSLWEFGKGERKC